MKPFVKWVGGKSQLIQVIQKKIPKSYNAYYEAFVGGGAVFLNIKSNKSNINDKNPILIHTYQIIKDNPNELIKILKNLDESDTSKQDYLVKRKLFNEKIKQKQWDTYLAALFIYINKRCFNGIFRVNSKGEFNVPFNNKINVSSYSEDNILKISKYLQNINIYNQDFEQFLQNPKKGDFVFIDSPYIPIKNSSFTQYTKDGFNYEDHLRLAKVIDKLHERGCYIMLTNSIAPLVYELYKKYNIEKVSVLRSINSIGNERKGEEVIITNY